MSCNCSFFVYARMRVPIDQSSPSTSVCAPERSRAQNVAALPGTSFKPFRFMALGFHGACLNIYFNFISVSDHRELQSGDQRLWFWLLTNFSRNQGVFIECVSAITS